MYVCRCVSNGHMPQTRNKNAEGTYIHTYLEIIREGVDEHGNEDEDQKEQRHVQLQVELERVRRRDQ